MKVKELVFKFAFCSMNKETFSDRIMIYKPNSTIIKKYDDYELKELSINKISELIKYLKVDTEINKKLGEWGEKYFTLSTIYIYDGEYLFSLRTDKRIEDVYNDFNTEYIEFIYFIIEGGASLHNEGYRYTIHSNEKNHMHMPHVHVWKDGVECRYALDTLKPIDKVEKPHKKDNKKITLFLRKNYNKLMELWNQYQKGYNTPELDQDGKQWCKES